MKKAIVVLLAVCLCVGLCSCGDISAAATCEVLIRQIGDVTIDSEMLILTAENAYNNLTEKDKQKIDNQAEVLRSARQAYNELLSETYDSAVVLFEQKRHEEALALFEKIATYSDSSDYIYSCVLAISAREHFEGSWRWEEDSSFNSDLINNDVYLHAWNLYDEYIIDFEAQTITLKFKSSTTEFEEVRPFIILSSMLLKCQEFRDNGDDYIYIQNDTEGIVITRGTGDSLPLLKSE